MHATCPHCQRGFAVPDGKVPPGKEVAVICPACKGRFSLSSSASPPARAPVLDVGPRADASGAEERQASGGVCCVADAGLRERIVAVLEKAGHGLVCPLSPEQGLEMLRFTNLPLVVYQEGFDPDPMTGVWGSLCAQSGEERRRVFIVWVGKGVSSEDPMLTLSKSADLVVDEKDVNDLCAYLIEAQEERKRFYGPLRSILKELGLETSLPE